MDHQPLQMYDSAIVRQSENAKDSVTLNMFYLIVFVGNRLFAVYIFLEHTVNEQE
jgi:hypothetical protein